jgi:hypothetical protein
MGKTGAFILEAALDPVSELEASSDLKLSYYFFPI